MSYFLQNLVFALNNGACYALIALGYTMVYGVLRLINFAHGDVFMIGAYVGAYVGKYFSGSLETQPWYVALFGIFCSMVICGGVGFVIERLAYRPLRKSPKLSALITAIGVSLLIEYLAQIKWTFFGHTFFGPDPLRVLPIEGFTEPIGWIQKSMGIALTLNNLLIIFVAMVTLVVLFAVVQYSRFGKAMRALSQNADASRLMGINVNSVISKTFVMGSMLAAIGGCLFGLNQPQCTPLMGVMPGLKAFVAAVIGGIGNLPGAAVGGLVIALVETYVNTVQYNGSAILSPYKDAILFAILILVLLVKPEGIFGKAVPEKV